MRFKKYMVDDSWCLFFIYVKLTNGITAFMVKTWQITWGTGAGYGLVDSLNCMLVISIMWCLCWANHGLYVLIWTMFRSSIIETCLVPDGESMGKEKTSISFLFPSYLKIKLVSFLRVMVWSRLNNYNIMKDQTFIHLI